MTRLIWVRHGETLWNRESRLQGSSETALSDAGRRQAEMLAGAVGGPLHAVFTSPLARAGTFAAPLCARHKLEPVILPELKEMCFGLWEGKTYAEMDADNQRMFIQWRRDPESFPPPQGETLEQVACRARGALTKITAALEQDMTAAVVTHGGVIRVMLASLLGMHLAAAAQLRISPASVTVLELVADRWELALLNDTCHLQVNMPG
jgi:broad specificity phosphatase PhoE